MKKFEFELEIFISKRFNDILTKAKNPGWNKEEAVSWVTEIDHYVQIITDEITNLDNDDYKKALKQY